MNDTAMLEVRRAMEEEYDDGRVKLLGLSNINLAGIELILENARIKPTFVQNRCQAKYDWDKDVRELCVKNDIRYQGFWLVTGNRQVIKHPDVVRAAEFHGKTPAQLLLRYVLSYKQTNTCCRCCRFALESCLVLFETSEAS